MSILIVLLPEQPRLSAHAADAPPAQPSEWDYLFSPDGRQVGATGRAAPADWPAAQTLVAVVPATSVGWHRITAPKAPAARLRQALAGLLEEALLDDESVVHLAVAPGLKAGEPLWVAALNKAWIAGQLAALEASGRSVDRLVPAWAPDDAPAGHVFRPTVEVVQGGDEGVWLAWRDAEGPVCLPVASDACRALLAQQAADLSIQWSCTPDTADEAARLAGGTVASVSPGDWALAQSRSPWNLRQFDLAPRRKGSKAAGDLWRRFRQAPEWRPVRWGLVALVAVQVVGAQVWAWQQRSRLAEQKQASIQLLQATFPQVRAIREAPVQMRKEVELLRVAAGRPGESDVEPMLSAADAAWPPTRGPADSLKYEPGRLTLGSTGWTPAEVDGFRERLRSLGYTVEAVPGRLSLSPYVPKPGEGPASLAPHPGEGGGPPEGGPMPGGPMPAAGIRPPAGGVPRPLPDAQAPGAAPMPPGVRPGAVPMPPPQQEGLGQDDGVPAPRPGGRPSGDAQ